MQAFEQRSPGQELAPDNLHPFSRMVYHANLARTLRFEASAAADTQDFNAYFDKRVELHYQEMLRDQAEQDVDLLDHKTQAELYEELLQRMTGGQYPYESILPKGKGGQEIISTPAEQTMQPAEWDAAYAADVARYEQRLDELRRSREFQAALVAEQLGRLAA